MQLYLKKILNYLFLLIFIFIIINLLISISWQIYSKLNKKPNAYNQKQLELLNLSNLDSEKLFRETWIDRHYVYDQFTEYKEKEKSGREFVNISNKDGRKIINNKNCKTNFAFYGSSITFGYNVTDQKTFSQLFKNILDDNYKFGCVYNYGRAGYGSTQENILFIKHIIDNDRDFFYLILLDYINWIPNSEWRGDELPPGYPDVPVQVYNTNIRLSFLITHVPHTTRRNQLIMFDH